MLPVILVGVVVFFTLGGLVAWNIGNLLEIHPDQLHDARLMLGLLVIGHGMVLFGTPFMVGLHVRQKFVWLNVIRLGEQLLRMSLLFVFLFGVSTSVLWVVVSTVIALLTASSVQLLFSRRMVPELRFERAACRWSLTRELTSFGAWTMLGNLVYRIRTSADVIVLNKLSTPVDVNSFHVGMIPDRQMDGLVSVASITMQPALTAMHATNRDDRLRNAYVRGNRYYLWLALAVAAPLFVFARELAFLYTKGKYLEAAVVLTFISARYPLNYASEMLYQVSMAKARIRGFFTVVSISGLIHIAVTITLVGVYGMGVRGVAYTAFGMAVVVQLGVLWPMGLRLLDLPFRRYLRDTLLPGYLPAAAAVLVGFGAKALLHPHSWLTVGVGVLACGVTHLAMVVLVSRPDDRRDAAQVYAKIRGRFARRDAAGPAE
jgi:O-antigen/teichoic acid export membrane protein